MSWTTNTISSNSTRCDWSISRRPDIWLRGNLSFGRLEAEPRHLFTRSRTYAVSDGVSSHPSTAAMKLYGAYNELSYMFLFMR